MRLTDKNADCLIAYHHWEEDERRTYWLNYDGQGNTLICVTAPNDEDSGERLLIFPIDQTVAIKDALDLSFEDWRIQQPTSAAWKEAAKPIIAERKALRDAARQEKLTCKT